MQKFLLEAARRRKKDEFGGLGKTLLPKNKGFGFRNIRNFNKTLLAKQAWRNLTKGNSLMAKLLKGKYFPNLTLFDVKIISNILGDRFWVQGMFC